MRYAVVKHYQLQDTVAHVNAALREGWAVAGGIAFCEGGYAQALVHREEKALPLPDGVHEYRPHPASVL
jgi:hypothetical protein